MNEIYKSDIYEYYHRLEEFPNYAISNWGNLINIETTTMKIWTFNEKRGYYQCVLYNNGQYKTIYRGKTVLKSFIPYPEDGKYYECDHINIDRKNDKLSNLRWALKKEQNENRKAYGAVKEKFIYMHRKSYCVDVRNLIRKTFTTLEKAIEVRNKICDENRIKY